ncbi:MAG: hypothetical protein K9K63_13485 [Desulfotignum sp.]|nr:hypothetical protein [Desulfotignum sp.]MCF8089049.1 hypothetical protein [Desulfotignum sp.]MCF8138313.1 hypothetical protein [Desulfotignum sp.]
MNEKRKIHRICIYGTGGIGGFFGAKIAHTCNQDHRLAYDCFFVARGDHLQAIRQKGITLIFSMPCRSIINGALILIRISGANTCLSQPLP